MKKLTKEQIIEMKKLREKKISTFKIAEMFNVTQGAVIYHTNGKRQDRKEYQREYHKRRYKKDKEFREKQVAATLNSRMKNK